ncbi:hypothetical protein AURDEDRAFT_170717 [Auricularia subglabra TFB-10046 SS5]|uniref:Fungal-type protein kinase domain-containing protein n=1 Tax=Auricularia subglabra (strain TFB-10046 / SS5) TaxID=717982 RepID=J0DCH4_AURST|nr:hypothetical protein AURDEDRAFT_170717 [Auricularia subglabra TFB-10046 SS5]
MELEVCGLVFQHAEVPYLFFPKMAELDGYIPNPRSTEVRTLLKELDILPGAAERPSYSPLTRLMTLISNKLPRSSASGASPVVFFFVYDKRMADSKDGAGRLMPDALASETKFRRQDSVPWIAVRIAVEVKESWSSAIQQALTYARSMLEVGNKWYSLVIVYQQISRRICFCFATRQGVYLSPSWRLAWEERDQFHNFASALLHACYYSGTRAGLDGSRSFDSSGCLHFNIPGLGLLKNERELFHRIQVIGRATHVYRVQSAEYSSFEPNEYAIPMDPPGLEDKLAATGDELVHLTDLEAANPVMRVQKPGPFGAPESAQPPTSYSSFATHGVQPPPLQPQAPSGSPMPDPMPDAHPHRQTAPSPPQLIPTVSSSSSSIDQTWESLCQRGTAPYWVRGATTKEQLQQTPFVVKDTWVLYERRNVEISVLQKVRGQYGFVEYAGHMVVPHPGMEALSFFQKGDPSTYKASDWYQVYPDENPPTVVQRIHKLMFYTSRGLSIETLGRDSNMTAHAMKDISTALFILFKLGISHRDVSTGNVLRLESPLKRSAAEVTDLLGTHLGPRFKRFMPLFETQYVFLCDFDHAVRWNEKRTYAPGRSGTWGFLPAARMAALTNGDRSWEDGPIDDLEALLMVLFYNTLKANISDASPMEKRHYASFHSDDAYHLCATKHMFLGSPSNAPHLQALRKTWPLWWRVFGVATKARLELNEVRTLLHGGTFAEASWETKKQLDTVTENALFGYLNAVEEALTDIAWDK